MLNNEVEPRQLTEIEKKEAVDRAVRACAMCSSDLWQDLAAHLSVPGAAITMGQILGEYPEEQWRGIVESALRRTTVFMEFIGAVEKLQADAEQSFRDSKDRPK